MNRRNSGRLVFWILALSFISPYVDYLHPVGFVGYGHIFLIALVGVSLIRNFRIHVPLLLLLPSLLMCLSAVSGLANVTAERFNIDINDVIKWSFLQLILFCYYLLFKNSNFPREKFFLAALVGLSISLTLAWVSWLAFPTYLLTVPMLHQLEGGHFLINRNYVGYFVSLGVCLSFAFFIRSASKNRFPSRSRFIYGLIFCYFCLSALLSFSKGTWLASLVGVGFIMALYDRRALRNLFSFLCMGLLFFIFGFGESEWFSDLLLKLSERVVNSSSSNQDRYNYLIDAVVIIEDNIWVGVGPGAYSSATAFYSLNETSDPHNAFLWIFAELGILGLLIGASFMLLPILLLLVNKHHDFSIYLIALWIPTSINAFLHGLPLVSHYSWFVYACLLGIFQNKFVRL